MVFILIILLIFFFFITYYLFGKDILSLTTLTSLMFTFSAVFVLINRNKWNVNLRLETVLLIVGGIIPLFIGEMLVRIAYLKKHAKRNIERKSISPEKKYITNKWCIIAIMALFTYFIYKLLYVYNIAGLYGLGGTILGNYRQAISLGKAEISTSIKIFDLMSLCISYFFMYVFMDNKIFQEKSRKIYLIPIILYLLICALSSSRIQYIYFITYVFVIWYVMLENKCNWSYKFSSKFMKNGALTIVAFFIAFYFLGYLTGKSSSANIFDYISIYTGGSIPALDEFMKSFKYDIGNFGSTTLIGVNALLQYLGQDGFANSRDLEFISFGGAGIRTNVYTCYMRLLNDYGYIGMIMVRFFMGVIYTNVYMKIKYNFYKKNEDLMILLYASFFFPIVMQPIDEVFFKSVITITTIIQIIVCYLMFQMLKSNIKVKI